MKAGKESSGNWKYWVIGILVVVILVMVFWKPGIRLTPPGGTVPADDDASDGCSPKISVSTVSGNENYCLCQNGDSSIGGQQISDCAESCGDPNLISSVQSFGALSQVADGHTLACGFASQGITDPEECDSGCVTSSVDEGNHPVPDDPTGCMIRRIRTCVK